MRDAQRVQERTHHRPMLGEVIHDERSRGNAPGQRAEAGQVARLPIDVEAGHRLRPEFLLLRDQERGLRLIVHGFLVLPERACHALPLFERHRLPQPRRSERGVGH